MYQNEYIKSFHSLCEAANMVRAIIITRIIIIMCIYRCQPVFLSLTYSCIIYMLAGIHVVSQYIAIVGLQYDITIYHSLQLEIHSAHSYVRDNTRLWVACSFVIYIKQHDQQWNSVKGIKFVLFMRIESSLFLKK